MHATAARPANPVAAPLSWSRIAFFTLPLAHLFSAWLHVYFGGFNTDEGFYAVAARSAMAGELPYRDFGYTQLPLLPFLNGPLLALTGYGLFAQRWVNAFWAALALLAAWRCLRARTGDTVALAAVATFTLSPAWMHYTHLGKTYALVTLLATLASWAFLSLPPGGRKMTALGVLGIVAVGCRLPAAPFFAVLWLAAWCERGLSVRARLVAVAILFASGLALIAPFYAAAPESAWFWTVTFHRLSVPLRPWHVGLAEILSFAPAWWIALAAAAAIALRRRALGSRPHAIVAAAALVAIAANAFPGGAYAEYLTPFLLPLAIGVAGELGRALHEPAARPAPQRGFVLLLVGAIAAAHVFLVPALAFSSGRATTPRDPAAWAPPLMEPYELDLPQRLARARMLVAQSLPSDAPLLGPNIILAAETGRRVPPTARMGPFSSTAEFSEDEAARLHLLTLRAWERELANPRATLVAFFTTARANYAWSVPSFRVQPREASERWLQELRRDFEIVQQEQHFLLLARREAMRQ